MQTQNWIREPHTVNFCGYFNCVWQSAATCPIS
jgi:hypothetical protein